MSANMDLAATQNGQMLPPSRRPYKRVTPQIWEQKKDQIRELYIVQDKTLKDVVRILKDRDGFDVGERQLKRKTDAWGFVKNIPSDEMQKMVRKRKRREDDLAKTTKFMRRHGDGEFQEVAQDRLDTFQRRFGLNNASSMSVSSGLPSNIMYHTPSNGNRDRSDNSLPRNSDQRTSEFNESVERIFDATKDQADSPTPPLQATNAIGTRKHCLVLYKKAIGMVYDGNYQHAGQIFKLVSLCFAEVPNTHRWEVVAAEFFAALMKAANFPGCPQSLIARFTQELSRFLIRERRLYTQTNAQVGSLVELKKTLTALRMNARWASILIPQQRVLQIWEPVLGPEHQKIKLIHDQITTMKNRKFTTLEQRPDLIRNVENSAEALIPDDIPQLRSINNLLHLCDGSPDDLLPKFLALESSDISNNQIRHEMRLLQYGRSRSLLGGYYSFLQKFDDAEKAFQESDRCMKYEDCVEIKLHRILWYAEHKTRVGDNESVGMLIRRAHKIFMDNDSPTEFILTHFPDRFYYLCKAASKQVPIDEVLDEHLDDDTSERHQMGSRPMSVVESSLDRPDSPKATPIPSPDRLFPTTPRGFNSVIDVEIWRQFVHFPPQ